MIFIPCIEISLIFFMFLFIVSNHFDVHFRRIGPLLFLSKDGKVAVRERKNGLKGAYFPTMSASFSFDTKYD